MKEIEKEADRLIELYRNIDIDYGEDELSKRDSRQCAIIDVSNTIEVFNSDLLRLTDKYKFHKQVKELLESKI